MSDLIKRDDALRIVDVAEDEHPYKVPGLFVTYSEYNQGWSDAVDFIRSRMEKADSVPAAPRWHRVEEQLPEPGQDVLVCTYFYGRSIYVVAWLDNEGKWSFGTVTHWMPIEPPKEE